MIIEYVENVEKKSHLLFVTKNNKVIVRYRLKKTLVVFCVIIPLFCSMNACGYTKNSSLAYECNHSKER